MPYRLPTFNLMCNIWHGVDIESPRNLGTPDVTVSCGLQFGRKNAGSNSTFVYLLVPALTDVRLSSWYDLSFQEIVECPAGSGRWYWVYNVDDVGKGFANEYRVGTMLTTHIHVGYLDQSWAWPFPIP